MPWDINREAEGLCSVLTQVCGALLQLKIATWDGIAAEGKHTELCNSCEPLSSKVVKTWGLQRVMSPYSACLRLM